MQAAIQAAMAAVTALRKVDTGPVSGTSTPSAGEACRHRHGVPNVRQESSDLKAPDIYVGHLDFEIEVMNILQTRMHELIYEDKVPIIKT